MPDILANSGGVVVSYLEWVQNLGRLYWTEDVMNSRLEEKNDERLQGGPQRRREARRLHEDRQRSSIGVGRVADAVRTLGLWP